MVIMNNNYNRKFNYTNRLRLRNNIKTTNTMRVVMKIKREFFKHNLKNFEEITKFGYT